VEIILRAVRHSDYAPSWIKTCLIPVPAFTASEEQEPIRRIESLAGDRHVAPQSECALDLFRWQIWACEVKRANAQHVVSLCSRIMRPA
jgi:hypothetical protein